jgi:hypothetical protein
MFPIVRILRASEQDRSSGARPGLCTSLEDQLPKVRGFSGPDCSRAVLEAKLYSRSLSYSRLSIERI